jgi:4-hydroxythreonine-4-phosphate dehydrogenase
LATGQPQSDLATEPKIDARGGQLAYECLVRATNLALKGQVAAIVTAPLHKIALQAAGHDWPGHTELLAHLCGVQEHAMMLYLPPGKPRHGGDAGFGVVHVTLHMAMREIFSHLTIESIDEKIRLANEVFIRIRRAMNLTGVPRIAVAALNPHAGEGGRFGSEEQTLIGPAVSQARASGIDVVGPLPVDTLMPRAVDGAFDAVVAMYHDQGHIALKLLDMFDAVNITLGLPILRTSVAHGTAHDIAWQNRAEASGMVQAVLTAARLATH